jgi:hypothetical protein
LAILNAVGITRVHIQDTITVKKYGFVQNTGHIRNLARALLSVHVARNKDE